ncbi:protein of unknown function [Beijerinckiaceae bacterium RH AL1]|nr:response regulator [Beijerinckiaceae bacterium]VVB45774.1 protein of unknown function [Beijerinckiaceae bacterium RH CH11]VVB45850.1 protein of unknown function [Beijerinckiaceae bacterium RH AL8]VVC55034.1 protein of unknown function [Beijerinckiaceae bacterium RH AL1]
MTVQAKRALDAYFDQSQLDAVGRSTRFARRALRARSAFFWSPSCQPAGLIGHVGETSEIDAGALASSFAMQAVAATGPVAFDTSCALGGVAVRVTDGAQGVLFVADPAPRAFDADDLALIDDVGASLGRELARGSAETGVPLATLVQMSDALVREAGTGGGMAPDDYLAAADRLAAMATQLREIAAAGARVARLESPLEREAPVPHGGGATILLADDLDLNRKLISDMLTVEGHQVDCVADGAAAVAAVKAKAYDLVLMDMIMPVMDGITATRAIRALPTPSCNVPIVALTANTYREELASCLEAGMDATLTKPMTFEMLTSVVADWSRNSTAAA